MEKYLKYISLVISIIGAFFFFKVLGNGDDEATVGMFIGFTKWVLIITVLIVLVFSVINLVKNPKAMKKALFAVIALAIVFGIAYVLAKDNTFDIKTAAGVDHISASLSKNVDTGIYASLILGAIAFFGFIVDSVKSLVK